METVGTGWTSCSVVPPRALPRDRAAGRPPGTDPKRGLAPRVISPAVVSARRRPPESRWPGRSLPQGHLPAARSRVSATAAGRPGNAALNRPRDGGGAAEDRLATRAAP